MEVNWILSDLCVDDKSGLKSKSKFKVEEEKWGKQQIWEYIKITFGRKNNVQILTSN